VFKTADQTSATGDGHEADIHEMAAVSMRTNPMIEVPKC
jgi:hypothetical protein